MLSLIQDFFDYELQIRSEHLAIHGQYYFVSHPTNNINRRQTNKAYKICLKILNRRQKECLSTHYINAK